MKIELCERCGGGEFFYQDGYRICQYCKSKYFISHNDAKQKGSTISLDKDIKMLLQKCRDDPANAQRYASLILDMDPGNAEAKKYLDRGGRM